MIPSTLLTPPQPDEFEVTLFGPGYGEAAVVHLGDGEWLLVDSCMDPSTRRPATTQYLQALGVNISTAVKLVVISHFDDDHCRGIAEVVAEAEAAEVYVSAAMTTDEFASYAVDPASVGAATGHRGTRAIVSLQVQADVSQRGLYRALARLPLYDVAGDHRTTQSPVRVTALSPSQYELDRCIRALGKLALRPGERARRAIPRKVRNHLTIALWIDAGPVRVLLGGDLEVTKNAREGWLAVLGLAPSLRGRASLFKVPHHGSSNAHHADVWGQMLDPQSVALVAPWHNGGRTLPRPADRRRIRGLTPHGHLTTDPAIKIGKSAIPHVERVLQEREGMGRLKRLGPTMGAVRARAKPAGGTYGWTIDYLTGNPCAV